MISLAALGRLTVRRSGLVQAISSSAWEQRCTPPTVSTSLRGLEPPLRTAYSVAAFDA